MLHFTLENHSWNEVPNPDEDDVKTPTDFSVLEIHVHVNSFRFPNRCVVPVF